MATLPISAMAQLCEGAAFSTVPDHGPVSEYVYEWPDFAIRISVMPDSKMSAHLEGFVEYLRNAEGKSGSQLSGELIARIRETRLVLGVIASPDIEEASRFDRLQEAIGTICFNTKSLLFWEGCVHDENADLVFPLRN